jgi:N-acetylneuraminic acid mutarotase
MSGDQWQQLSSMPSARSEMPATALDGLIYVPGGFGGETVFEAYDPGTDSWASLAELPDGRHHLMAVAHAGLVFILGGGMSMLNWEPQATTWAFDPGKGAWEERASMPESRLAGAAVSLGDYLYVIGGADIAGAAINKGRLFALPGTALP